MNFFSLMLQVYQPHRRNHWKGRLGSLGGVWIYLYTSPPPLYLEWVVFHHWPVVARWLWSVKTSVLVQSGRWEGWRPSSADFSLCLPFSPALWPRSPWSKDTRSDPVCSMPADFIRLSSHRWLQRMVWWSVCYTFLFCMWGELWDTTGSARSHVLFQAVHDPKELVTETWGPWCEAPVSTNVLWWTPLAAH